MRDTSISNTSSSPPLISPVRSPSAPHLTPLPLRSSSSSLLVLLSFSHLLPLYDYHLYHFPLFFCSSSSSSSYPFSSLSLIPKFFLISSSPLLCRFLSTPPSFFALLSSCPCFRFAPLFFFLSSASSFIPLLPLLIFLILSLFLLFLFLLFPHPFPLLTFHLHFLPSYSVFPSPCPSFLPLFFSPFFSSSPPTFPFLSHSFPFR